MLFDPQSREQLKIAVQRYRKLHGSKDKLMPLNQLTYRINDWLSGVIFIIEGAEPTVVEELHENVLRRLLTEPNFGSRSTKSMHAIAHFLESEEGMRFRIRDLFVTDPAFAAAIGKKDFFGARHDVEDIALEGHYEVHLDLRGALRSPVLIGQADDSHIGYEYDNESRLGEEDRRPTWDAEPRVGQLILNRSSEPSVYMARFHEDGDNGTVRRYFGSLVLALHECLLDLRDRRGFGIHAKLQTGWDSQTDEQRLWGLWCRRDMAALVSIERLEKIASVQSVKGV